MRRNDAGGVQSWCKLQVLLSKNEDFSGHDDLTPHSISGISRDKSSEESMPHIFWRYVLLAAVFIQLSTQKQTALLSAPIEGSPSTSKSSKRLEFKLAHVYYLGPEKNIRPVESVVTKDFYLSSRQVFSRVDVTKSENDYVMRQLSEAFPDNHVTTSSDLESSSSIGLSFVSGRRGPMIRNKYEEMNRFGGVQPILERTALHHSTASNTHHRWSTEEASIALPDISDKDTVASMAILSCDAYSLPGDPDWIDIGHFYPVGFVLTEKILTAYVLEY